MENNLRDLCYHYNVDYNVTETTNNKQSICVQSIIYWQDAVRVAEKFVV